MSGAHGLLRMQHGEDPREELLREVGELDAIEVMHNMVLVAIYKRPDMTASGIALPETTRKEDEWQGKIGLVLKKGPVAFKDDERNKFHGQDVQRGDWVAFRVQDASALTVAGKSRAVPCRMLEDVHIKMKLTAPDAVF